MIVSLCKGPVSNLRRIVYGASLIAHILLVLYGHWHDGYCMFLICVALIFSFAPIY